MANAVQAAYQGTNQTGTPGTSVPTSASHNVTAGWSAVVICRTGDNVTHTRPKFSSGTDDIFTQVGSTVGSAGNDYISMWYCANCSAHTSVTVSAFFSSSAYNSVLVGYWSGGLASSPLSFNATGSTGTGTSVTNTGTWTNAAGDIVIAAMSYGNAGRTFSAGAIGGPNGTMWKTSDGSTSGDTGMCYRVISDAAGSRTAAMSISGSENGLTLIVAGFKVAAGSAGWLNRNYWWDNA
jgi:hypothetical protein